MNRSITDAALKTTKAMPAAAANNNHDGIDLGAVRPRVTLESVDVLITVPALPSLSDTKVATFKLQDSADNVTFTDIAELSSFTRTGAGGVGSAATTRRVKLPPGTRRYISVNQAVESAGGTNTAVSTTVEVLL